MFILSSFGLSPGGDSCNGDYHVTSIFSQPELSINDYGTYYIFKESQWKNFVPQNSNLCTKFSAFARTFFIQLIV